MHEKRLGAGETRGNGAFNKHCLQPNPGILAPSIPMIVYFDSQVNSYVNHLALSPQNHTKMVSV